MIGVSYFWMTRERRVRPVPATNESYFRRLAEKSSALTTWAGVMRKHGVRMRTEGATAVGHGNREGEEESACSTSEGGEGRHDIADEPRRKTRE